jgi:hypothetical protein
MTLLAKWVAGFTSPSLAGAALAHRLVATASVMQALKRPQKEKVKQFCVFTGAK